MTSEFIQQFDEAILRANKKMNLNDELKNLCFKTAGKECQRFLLNHQE